MPFRISYAGPAIQRAANNVRRASAATTRRQALLADRDFAFRQNSSDQAATLERERRSSYEDAQNQDRELRRELTTQQLDARSEESRLDFERQGIVDQERYERNLGLADEAMRRQIESGDLQYSREQERRIDEINAARDQLNTDPRWNDGTEATAQEKARILAELDQQSASTVPLPVPPSMRTGPEWPKGQGVGETWTDESTGTVFTRDDSGNVKTLSSNLPKIDIGGGVSLPAGELVKLSAEVMKLLTVKDEISGKTTVPTPAEVRQFILDMAGGGGGMMSSLGGGESGLVPNQEGLQFGGEPIGPSTSQRTPEGLSILSASGEQVMVPEIDLIRTARELSRLTGEDLDADRLAILVRETGLTPYQILQFQESQR